MMRKTISDSTTPWPATAARPARQTASVEILPATRADERAAAIEAAAARVATLTDVATAQAAAHFVSAVRVRVGEVTTRHAAVRRLMKQTVDAILADERATLAAWERADALVTAALTAWRKTEEAAARARAQAALDAATSLAAARRQDQIALLAAEATSAATAQDRRLLTQQAKELRAAPVLSVVDAAALDTATPKLAGVTFVTRYSAVVTDQAAFVAAAFAGIVPRAALQPSQAWLDAQVTSLGMDLHLPGVTVTEDTGLRRRA